MNDHNEALLSLISPEVEAEISSKSVEALVESLNENLGKLDACGESIETVGFLAGHKEIMVEAFAYAREHATNPIEFNKFLVKEMERKTSRLFVKQLRQAPVRFLSEDEMANIAKDASEYGSEMLMGIISDTDSEYAAIVAEEATRKLMDLFNKLHETGVPFTNRVISDLTRQVTNGLLKKHGFDPIFS